MKTIVSLDTIQDRIYRIRGHKVMLSLHLAELYNVTPKALVQAVKRNRYRFPPDFMFQLTVSEFENLKSQIVTSSWGGLRRDSPTPSQSRACPCSPAFFGAVGRLK